MVDLISRFRTRNYTISAEWVLQIARGSRLVYNSGGYLLFMKKDLVPGFMRLVTIDPNAQKESTLRQAEIPSPVDVVVGTMEKAKQFGRGIWFGSQSPGFTVRLLVTPATLKWG